MEAELQQVQAVYTLIATCLVTYSFQIIGALIILLLGLLVARKVGQFVEMLLLRHKVNVTLSRFTGAGVKMLLILEVLEGVAGVSRLKPPQVGIDAFGENGIAIGVRFWTRTEVLFQTRYLAHAEIHRMVTARGIDIPFPQREVRLLQDAVS